MNTETPTLQREAPIETTPVQAERRGAASLPSSIRDGAPSPATVLPAAGSLPDVPPMEDGARASSVGTLSLIEAATARVRATGGSLTSEEMPVLLAEAGWPEHLVGAAMRVAWCESKWSPYAIGDGGRSLGLFQLAVALWFDYAHEDPEQWADPLVNARTAWAVYQYDEARGQLPFAQWTCQP